jgi:hypothetical protein
MGGGVYAETIDTGATVSFLRAFGPPDVISVPDFAGNSSTIVGADGFWTLVRSVSLHLATTAAAADRLARLSWQAEDVHPFAQVVSPFAVQASHASEISFVADAQQAGAANAAAIVVGLPELVLLPGWTLTVDVVAGVAGDAVTGVRVYLQRYQLVELVDLLPG